jgi:hypothetical protein
MHGQRFAVSRDNAMDMANDLAILLEIKVPSICVDLLAEGRIRGAGRALFFLFTVAVLRPARRLLAIRTRQLLVKRVQAIGFGVDTGAGGQF